MDTEINTNEDVIEALDENSKETHSILEGNLQQNARNGDISVEQLESQDKILKELQKPSPIEALLSEIDMIQGKDGKDSVVPGPKGDKGEDSTVPGPKGDKGEDGKDSVVPGPEGPPGPKGESIKGKDGSPDTPKQVKEKLLKVGIDYDDIKNTPDIEKIVKISSQASKTVSLVELDDIVISNLEKDASGKYILGAAGGVEQYADLASFPATGETDILYIAQDTNLSYRWSGSVYVKVGAESLLKGNNLSDLLDVGTARSNLGLNTWWHYIGATKFQDVTVTITGGDVLTYTYEPDSSTVYRYITTATTGLYPTEDSFYSTFDGTTLSDLITTR